MASFHWEKKPARPRRRGGGALPRLLRRLRHSAQGRGNDHRRGERIPQSEELRAGARRDRSRARQPAAEAQAEWGQLQSPLLMFG
jgi:hypothetical protein